MESNRIIVTTPEQLQEFINNAINDILPKLAELICNNKPVENDVINTVNAARFLSEHGPRITSSKLRAMVHNECIPYRKFGRRVVFSKRELLAWIESRTEYHGSISSIDSKD